ncbi:MAG: glycosyltransferase family 2 protein [Nanoarchaeota archaeon]
MGGTVWIVVPAYNEEHHIEGVIGDLKSHGYNNIVVIDDGSNDRTGWVSQQAGATVLRHVLNRGQGAGLKTGIDFALQEGADYIVTFDSDGQHMAKDIAPLLAPVQARDAEVALGSRFLTGSIDIPFSRRILLKGSIFVIWLFYGIKMTDAHNGFRILSKDAASKINIKSNRMEHASEIINEIKRNKLRYIELPVTIRYNDPRHLKGQGSYTGAVKIFLKMILQKLMR